MPTQANTNVTGTGTDKNVKPTDVRDTEVDTDTAPDWEKHAEKHPEETWISYVDSDGNPQRVPVWHYRTLGL